MDLCPEARVIDLDSESWREWEEAHPEHGREREDREDRVARRVVTSTPEFKRWFGQSKAVDRHGDPLVFYHGSVNKGVTIFDPTRPPVRPRSGPAGISFTTERWSASSYTRPRGASIRTPPGDITVAYLSIQNPLDITGAIKKGQEKGLSFGDAKREALKALTPEHDGVIFRGDRLNPDEYLVFKPEQIKSADKNTGTFDPKNPRIDMDSESWREWEERRGLDPGNPHPLGVGGKHGSGAHGTDGEGGRGTDVSTGAGAGGSDGAADGAAASAADTSVGPHTDRYIADREGRGDYTREFAVGLRTAVGGLPPSAKAWLEEGLSRESQFPLIQEIDLDSENVPSFVKSAMRSAAAATLNGYKILYAKGKIPDSDSLVHELVHTAYSQLEREAPELVQEGIDSARVMGTSMLDAAFSRQWRTANPPEDENLYRAWYGAKHVRSAAASVKRYLKAGRSDVTGSLELNLMIPSYELREFAKALGHDTAKMSDQWHEVVVYSALTKRYDAYVSSQYEGEELVTYHAGSDRGYAERLFKALAKRKRLSSRNRAAFDLDSESWREWEDKHGKDRGEKREPRVFNTPDDIKEHQGWPGDPPRWTWKDEPGRLITGRPLSRADLPPVLFHVTTAASAVAADGMLLGQNKDAGLGGGQSDGVSFTTDETDAQVIQTALVRAVQIARGEATMKDFARFAREDEEAAGLPTGTLDQAVKSAQEVWDSNYDYDRGKANPTYNTEDSWRSLVHDAFSSYLWGRDSHKDKSPLLKNPILFSNKKTLQKVDPANVRILRVKSSAIPQKALITSGSDDFLHEVRVYSDVPYTREGAELMDDVAMVALFDAFCDGTVSLDSDSWREWEERRGERQSVARRAVTHSPDFKAWFAGSKVVDDTGEPKVVYHGTTGDIDTFRLSPLDIGIHFGSSEAANEVFTSKMQGVKRGEAPQLGRNLMPVYLTIQNPLRVGDLDSFNPEALGPELERLGMVSDGKQWVKTVTAEGDRRFIAEIERRAPGARTKGDVQRLSGLSFDAQYGLQRSSHMDVAREWLQAKGHDGLVYENQFEGGGDSYVVFSPTQVKSATGNRGTFDPKNPRIDMRDGIALLRYDLDSESWREWEDRKGGSERGGRRTSTVSTKAFKQWFGDSKVTDEQGRPLVVYHGTTHDFAEFAPAGSDKYSAEAAWGAAPYFTNTQADVSENYAGEGPDLTNRIEQRADEIRSNSDDEMSAAEAKTKAREELVGKARAFTMPVYVAMQNPYIVGDSVRVKDHKETFLTFESKQEDPDDPDSDYAEPEGTLVDFIQAVRDEAHQFEETDGVEDFLVTLYEEGMDGGISASKLDKLWHKSEGTSYVLDRNSGASASGELYRRALARAGFDGVIDRTVNDKFGTGANRSKPMAGMNSGTVHYIPFKPVQIKSALGNKGTFDPTKADITLADAFDLDSESWRDWEERRGGHEDAYSADDEIPDYPGRDLSDHVSRVQVVPVGQLEPSETKLDADKVSKMVDAMRRGEAFPAVVVEFSGETDDGRDILSVIDGHHRLEASKRAGLSHIPVRVVVQSDDWSHVKASGGMRIITKPTKPEARIAARNESIAIHLDSESWREWEEAHPDRSDRATKVGERMKEVLGTTDEPRLTRFVLPDGTRIKGTSDWKDSHSTLAMRAGTSIAELENLGVVRYVGAAGVEVGQPLTEAQARLIVDDWPIYGTSLGVDVIRDGVLVASKEFYDPSVDVIIGFVRSRLTQIAARGDVDSIDLDSESWREWEERRGEGRSRSARVPVPAGHVALFRGDAKNVDPSLSYSDPRALFGAGVYLTTSPRIAGDYTAKGEHDSIFNYQGSGKSTKQEAIDTYIRVGLAPSIDEQGNDLGVGRYEPLGYMVGPDGLPLDQKSRTRLKLAKEKWAKEISKTVEVRKNADNVITIRKKEALAKTAVATYHIPETWLKQTLDAEDQIPEKVAAALHDTLMRLGDHQTARDLYDASMQKDEDGFRPSYRAMYTAITANSPLISEEGQRELRREMKALGYKGIRYSGGVTMGGAKHDAYVFWDEQGLKRRRAATKHLSDRFDFDSESWREWEERRGEDRDDPPPVIRRHGFVTPTGKDHYEFGLDHTEIARKYLKAGDDASVRHALRQGHLRYWVKAGEVDLNFATGHPRTVEAALQFLRDNYTPGDQIYIDIEGADDLKKFFDNIGEANRTLRESLKYPPPAPLNFPSGKRRKVSASDTTPDRFDFDSESWRAWEEAHPERQEKAAPTAAKAEDKATVESDLAWVSKSSVMVQDHPLTIRAARKVADVLVDMKAAGYRMPDVVRVLTTDSSMPSGRTTIPEGKTGAILTVRVPENAPPDMPLDDVVAKAFGGESAQTPGVPRFTDQTMQDVVVHEMAHIQQGRLMEDANGLWDLMKQVSGMNGAELLGKAFRQVSDYALTGGAEFVAEAFVKLFRGETLGAEAARLYAMLKGPQVLAALRDAVRGMDLDSESWRAWEEGKAKDAGGGKATGISKSDFGDLIYWWGDTSHTLTPEDVPDGVDFAKVKDAETVEELCEIVGATHEETIRQKDDPNTEISLVRVGGKQFVVDEDKLVDPTEWVNDLGDLDLEAWTGYDDFNTTFWESPGVVYHGTDADPEEILAEGLGPRNETRGMSNRSVGAAVFTTTNADTASYHYGKHLFEIDVDAMKRDGVMPDVEMEPEAWERELRQSVASMLQIDDYDWEPSDPSSADPDTVVFNDGIPAKYLKLISKTELRLRVAQAVLQLHGFDVPRFDFDSESWRAWEDRRGERADRRVVAEERPVKLEVHERKKLADEGLYLHGTSADFDTFTGGYHGAVYLSNPADDASTRTTQAEHIAGGPFGGMLVAVKVDESRVKVFDPLLDPAAMEIVKAVAPASYPRLAELQSRYPNERIHGGWVEYNDMPALAAATKASGYNSFRVWEPSVGGYSRAITDPTLLRVVKKYHQPGRPLKPAISMGADLLEPFDLDSESWRAWEEKHDADAPDSSQAQTITKDIVQGDIKRATGISLVNVEDHPNSIRAARKVGEVIRRMKAQGYKVPTALSVGRAMTPTVRGTMTTARTGGQVSYTDIVIDIPENAPDDMPLDDMVGKAFGGTTEDGTPNYTVRTFEDIVVHEMGHLQHRIALGNEQVSFDKLEKQGWPKIRLLGEAGKSVSMYALHNAYEFIAEAFTKLYRGEPLSASAEAVYRELNGPKVVTT